MNSSLLLHFLVHQFIGEVLMCFLPFSWHRYKKLLCTVDLTKDFFFSYSYHVMRSLQKNLRENVTGQSLYETMFVWNEFITRGIRNHLKSTLWTVALVYGFFKQVCDCLDLLLVSKCLKLFEPYKAEVAYRKLYNSLCLSTFL